jgi:putative ABC transport system ATP-binding protein
MNNKDNDILLTIKDLSVKLNQKSLFRKVNLTLNESDKIVIYGKSGCGKSTFILTLLGFVTDFSGEISFKNLPPLTAKNLYHIRKYTAWIPQETGLHFTNGEEIFNTVFGFKNNKTVTPSKNQIQKTLNQLNLPYDILDKPFQQLSGGEKQRLLINVGLLQNKPLLLLDEPTSALDKSNRKAVIEAIKNYPFACIMVSHDEDLLNAFENKINFENYTV